ncbi:unnamed protein product [Adineta steineri]|uniref:Uncharacterized protein n=1 Tax=Adineta steineri TaxID=433720 RepID=A0A813ZJ11_9BILA|nr:unnamed protein product [Adineta steineri]CAF0918229.1 unnamed protein product [Adineta steineri]CAF0962578.1 unnamed protein product [Adineta steineri]
MTTDFQNDICSDSFNPIDNRLEYECQATIKGKNGLFPARFCVKISGIIVDVDQNLNQSLIHKYLYLRTCITENIMDSTRSLDSTGNFRLKNFAGIKGEIKMQGTITLCTVDGCNQANYQTIDVFIIVYSFLFLIIQKINH